MRKRAYIANSWFNDDQMKMREAGLRALAENPTVDFDQSFDPKKVSQELVKVEGNPLEDQLWQQVTFQSDVKGIEKSDITIALYDPTIKNSDTGVIWEVGYSYGIHKPIYLVIPDEAKDSINLMPAIAATRVIKLSQLRMFDFESANYKPFEGTLF